MRIKYILNLVLILAVTAFIFGCTSSEQDMSDGDIIESSDSDIKIDGDIESDLDLIELDKEEQVSDGDLDLDKDNDRELIDLEPLGEDDGECGNLADAICFENGTEGQSGTMCINSGNDELLVYCEPSVPAWPACRNSEPKYTTQKICENGCVDVGKDGNAICADEPADGDQEDIETDTDIIEIETETDASEMDTSETDTIDIDGDITDTEIDTDLEQDQVESDFETDEELPYVCSPDQFESNNGSQSAATVTATTYQTLSICADDDDWFVIDLNYGDSMTASIDFNETQANLDIYLFDASGVQILDQSNSNDQGHEEVNLEMANSADYKLYVFSRGLQVDYTLTITIENTIDGDQENDTELFEVPEDEVEKEEVHICYDDNFEANDSKETASPVTAIAYSDLTLCESNNDFYGIDLKDEDFVEVDISFYHSEGNLDLYILSPSGSYIKNEISQSDNEHTTFTAISDGLHFIQVLSPTGDENSYSMDIKVTPHNPCPDDVLEDNDSISSPATPAIGNHPNLALCPYDNDWFAFDLLAGESLVVDVSFTHAAGNIDMVLMDNQEQVLDLSDSLTDNERVIYSAESAKTVYLQVYTFGILSLSYEMDVNITTEAICNDDIYEVNDNFQTAATINGNAEVSALMLCSSTHNTDWYKFALEENNILTAKVFFDKAVNPFRLVLWDEAEHEVAYHRSIEGGLETFVKAQADSEYTLQIAGIFFVDNDYDLEISVCKEDAHEPNDSYTTSYYFWTDHEDMLDMAICRGNEDWFSIDLYAGESVSLGIVFDWKKADLDLFMYNGNLLPVTQSTNTNDDELINFHATQTGSYYFKVVSFDDKDISYDLYMNVQTSGD